jgi:hypothetical protein
MPEFDVVMAGSDRHRLLQWTLEQGAVLVPDVMYPEPYYEQISSVAKLEQFPSARLFFVLRGDWQVEKLRMSAHVTQFKGNGFLINQRYGGPALSYLLYPQREEGGARFWAKVRFSSIDRTIP